MQSTAQAVASPGSSGTTANCWIMLKVEFVPMGLPSPIWVRMNTPTAQFPLKPMAQIYCLFDLFSILLTPEPPPTNFLFKIIISSFQHRTKIPSSLFSLHFVHHFHVERFVFNCHHIKVRECIWEQIKSNILEYYNMKKAERNFIGNEFQILIDPTFKMGFFAFKCTIVRFLIE